MPAVQPTLVAPTAALLSRIATLIREGVAGWIRPDPYAAPYWSGWDSLTARTGCPAGHFLLTEGTRMYLDDQRASVQAPYVVIAQAGNPEARGSRLPSVMWDVPVVVEMAWQGDDTESQIRLRLGMLQGLLCIDYPAADPQSARPISERLSASDLLVYGRDTITQVHPEELRQVNGHPACRLTFHVLCSSLASD